MTDRLGDARRGFTLMEVLSALLLVAIGLSGAVGLMLVGTRTADSVRDHRTVQATAEAVLIDANPASRSLDPGDLDGDGWGISSGIRPQPVGSYTFVVEGDLNGFYVRRVEGSLERDIISAHHRSAVVTVECFSGREGRYLTTLRGRILRTWAP